MSSRVVSHVNKVVYWLEVVVAITLVLMIALGVVALVYQLFVAMAAEVPVPSIDPLLKVVDVVLIVFILVELLNIAIAYMQHRNVLPTVLEAALVAVARKLVVFEIGPAALPEAAALALMLTTIGLTWFLLRRANVCGSDSSCVPEGPAH